MNLVLDYALELVGTPYKYGGKNPVEGLDCSGLVCELLRSAGALKWDEFLCAQQLYDRFVGRGGDGRFVAGALAFYGDAPNKVDHVAFLLDQYRMIEAGGGRATTLTVADAAAHHAFVKIRPIQGYRKGFLCVVKPSYATIGLVS